MKLPADRLIIFRRSFLSKAINLSPHNLTAYTVIALLLRLISDNLVLSILILKLG